MPRLCPLLWFLHGDFPCEPSFFHFKYSKAHVSMSSSRAADPVLGQPWPQDTRQTPQGQPGPPATTFPQAQPPGPSYLSTVLTEQSRAPSHLAHTLHVLPATLLALCLVVRQGLVFFAGHTSHSVVTLVPTSLHSHWVGLLGAKTPAGHPVHTHLCHTSHLWGRHSPGLSSGPVLCQRPKGPLLLLWILCPHTARSRHRGSATRWVLGMGRRQEPAVPTLQPMGPRAGMSVPAGAQ